LLIVDQKATWLYTRKYCTIKNQNSTVIYNNSIQPTMHKIPDITQHANVHDFKCVLAKWPSSTVGCLSNKTVYQNPIGQRDIKLK
jgi:hypothetical protein